MSKSSDDFRNQLAVAGLELQRVEALVSIATSIDFIANDTTSLQCSLANSVQRAALESVLTTLRPTMQVIQEDQAIGPSGDLG